MLDAAAGEGLVEVSEMLVEGRPEVFVSLPQEALAQATGQWDEERRRSSYGQDPSGRHALDHDSAHDPGVGISIYLARTFYAVPAFDGREKLDETVPFYKARNERTAENC